MTVLFNIKNCGKIKYNSRVIMHLDIIDLYS